MRKTFIIIGSLLLMLSFMSYGFEKRGGFETTFDKIFKVIGKSLVARKVGTQVGDNNIPIRFVGSFTGKSDSAVSASNADSLIHLAGWQFGRNDSFVFYAVKKPSLIDHKKYFNNIQEAIDSAGQIVSFGKRGLVEIAPGDWDLDTTLFGEKFVDLNLKGVILKNANTTVFQPKNDEIIYNGIIWARGKTNMAITIEDTIKILTEPSFIQTTFASDSIQTIKVIGTADEGNAYIRLMDCLLSTNQYQAIS